MVCEGMPGKATGTVKAWLHAGERPEEAAGDVQGLAEEALPSARL